jgi:glycosyltransferase involved in cell wall biosynthesis
MGYNIPVLRELVESYDAKIDVISWDQNKLTPYQTPTIENVTFHKRSKFDKNSILEVALQIKPDLVYVPNWYDKGYLPACKAMRKSGIPVVAGLDNQWRNTLKQWAGCLVMRLKLKNYFSHLWVSGPYQYEFARRLGFKKQNILFDFYSADVSAFAQAKQNKDITTATPHKFLFVGRLEPEKGIDVLLKAWNSISVKKDWDLTLIGSGSLKGQFEKLNGVTVKDFMQPDDLVNEISNYGCFVLPSRYEPYGVVLHEFAAAGMPLVASDCCGAAPIFVRSGYNGYQFNSGNAEDLANKLKIIINASQERLHLLGARSIIRSTVITPQTSAASLISALN